MTLYVHIVAVLKLSDRIERKCSMKNVAQEAHPEIQQIQRLLYNNKSWIIGLGVAFVVLGIIGLGMSATLSLTITEVFGVLLIVGGCIQLAHTFTIRGWKGRIYLVVSSFIYLLAGITIVVNPVRSELFITLMLAGMFVFVGVVRICMAFQKHSFRNRFWIIINGAISMILGIIILTNWPFSGLLFIGLLISVELILNGWTFIFFASQLRKP